MIRSAPYFWLTCDRCGESSTEGEDITAWSDIVGAEQAAVESYWTDEGGYHLCGQCDDDMVLAMEDYEDSLSR